MIKTFQMDPLWRAKILPKPVIAPKVEDDDWETDPDFVVCLV